MRSFLVKKNAERIFLVLFLVLSFALIGIVSQKVIQNFPNSADEYAYVFQAKNLAKGQLYGKLHPKGERRENLQRYFYFVHIGENQGRYYGRFPFGYSLLLVPAVAIQNLYDIDLLWVTNAILGVLTLLLLYAFGVRFFNKKIALISVLLGLVNPWFLFTSGSFFSHAACAFFMALFFFLFFSAFFEVNPKKRSRCFIYCGAVFGFGVWTRFLDPLAFLTPLVVFYFYRTLSHKYELNWRNFFQDGLRFFLGGVGFLIGLLLYHYFLTGNAFTTAYQFYNPHDQGTRFIFFVKKGARFYLDFSRVWTVGVLERTIPNIKNLFSWFPYLYVLFLFPLFFIRKIRTTCFFGNNQHRSIVSLLFLSSIMLFLLYALYGGPPMNQYGPRYFYSAFFSLVFLCAYFLGQLSHLLKKEFFWALVSVFILFSSYGIYKEGKDVYQNIFERRNLYRTVEESDIHNAIVFIKTYSGTMPPFDLTRNDLDFTNDVLFASSSREKYGPLIRYYSDRKFYEYTYLGPNRLGQLIPLRTDANGNFEVPGSI